MNQGKLEVVNQDMTRVNIDILGISEIRRTGMGEFNSDDHYIYYCGQERLNSAGLGCSNPAHFKGRAVCWIDFHWLLGDNL